MGKPSLIYTPTNTLEFPGLSLRMINWIYEPLHTQKEKEINYHSPSHPQRSGAEGGGSSVKHEKLTVPHTLIPTPAKAHHVSRFLS